LRNWAEAQVRSARYRALNAARLGAGLAAFAFAAFALFIVLTGQLPSLTGGIATLAQNQMASLGFTIRSVDVTGAEARHVAAVADATGAMNGQPAFAFDPSGARDNVVALSWVRDAQVARLWPDRVAVIVEPRTPFAVWQMEGRFHLIDRDGVVLEEVEAGAHPDLPLVVDRGAPEAAADFVDILVRYPEISRRTVAIVRVGSRRWNLRLESGADVKLPEDEAGAALALLAAMQAERGVLRLDAEVIDLRQPGEMIVRALPERAAAAGIRERDA
jgi:cell division protein FtsQ